MSSSAIPSNARHNSKQILHNVSVHKLNAKLPKHGTQFCQIGEIGPSPALAVPCYIWSPRPFIYPQSIFADDLLIWTSRSNLNMAAERLSILTNCNFWKLKMSVSKRTYTLHSLQQTCKNEPLIDVQIMREENSAYAGMKDRKL